MVFSYLFGTFGIFRIFTVLLGIHNPKSPPFPPCYFLSCLFISSSLSLEFTLSLCLLCLCLSSTVQDTTAGGVLSSCGCSLTLTLTTSMGIWDGAGATKVVTRLAAHRGIWYSAGATRSWFHSASWSKSFALIKRSLNSTAISYLDEKRNAQIWHSNTIDRHKKIILMRKTMWCQEILNPCCTTVRFLSIFFNFSSTALKISLFLSSLVRRLNLAVLHSLFKIKEFLHKMAISFWDSNSKRTKSFFSCQLY